ncbi:hypothetical protein LCGC14_0945680 [marine sediment metagenome]|uniref:Uncharacterized protein n=2 Tax=root TaxID=1 RepID=A0A0F9RQ49_9ZZZZ|nr:MAG: hypothetical protein LCMAC202_04030 [Marseillevirus LCMAC202]
MTCTKCLTLGTIATSAFCVIHYGSNPFALIGILPFAAVTSILGGWIIAYWVSRLNLPDSTTGGVAMAIIILSFIGGATFTGFATFIGLAKYFS